MDEVSHNTYVWAHVGVIAFHVIVALKILYVNRQLQKDPKYEVYGIGGHRAIMYIAAVLLIVSLLGLWPILASDDKITIE